ncbi:MAG: glycosyltransferase family 39 protein [Acidobacteriota bacterium]
MAIPAARPLKEDFLRRAFTPFSRHSSLVVGLVLAFHAVLAWVARRPGILTEQDDAIYVLLGRALHGFQYRELFRIDRPAHMMYPPVYPLVLSLWSAMGGEGFNWLVLISIASSVGMLALVYSSLRAVWSPGIALVCLVALATNPSLVDAAGGLDTEAPFTFFQVLALWTFTRVWSRSEAILAGAASIAAALTRSIGVTLIAAIGMLWLWRQHFRTLAVYAVVVALTVGLWLGWTALAPDQVPGKSYIADALAADHSAHASATSLLKQRLTNKAPYLLSIYLLLPGPGISTRAVDNVIGMLILLLALLLGSPALFAAWPAAFLYLTAYGGLLLLWPWPVARFIVPVLPLIVPITLVGVGRLVSFFRPRWEEAAIVLVAGVLALTGLGMVYSVIQRQRGCVRGGPLPSPACLDEHQASFFSAVRHIRDHDSPNAVFLSGKPATLYLYTGRRVVSMARALSQTPSDFLPFLRQQGATHILLLAVMPFSDGMSASRLALGPMLRANCESLQVEASFPPLSYLFRVPDAGETPDPIAACRAVDTYLEAQPTNHTGGE